MSADSFSNIPPATAAQRFFDFFLRECSIENLATVRELKCRPGNSTFCLLTRQATRSWAAEDFFVELFESRVRVVSFADDLASGLRERRELYFQAGEHHEYRR